MGGGTKYQRNGISRIMKGVGQEVGGGALPVRCENQWMGFYAAIWQKQGGCGATLFPSHVTYLTHNFQAANGERKDRLRKGGHLLAGPRTRIISPAGFRSEGLLRATKSLVHSAQSSLVCWGRRPGNSGGKLTSKKR